MKKFWLLIGTVLLLFALCACTDQEGDNKITASSKEASSSVESGKTTSANGNSTQENVETDETPQEEEETQGNGQADDAADGWSQLV